MKRWIHASTINSGKELRKYRATLQDLNLTADPTDVAGRRISTDTASGIRVYVVSEGESGRSPKDIIQDMSTRNTWICYDNNASIKDNILSGFRLSDSSTFNQLDPSDRSKVYETLVMNDIFHIVFLAPDDRVIKIIELDGQRIMEGADDEYPSILDFFEEIQQSSGGDRNEAFAQIDWAVGNGDVPKQFLNRTPDYIYKQYIKFNS